MQDTIWIATIAGIALGISVILAFFYVKSQTQTALTPVTIDYDTSGNPIRLREVKK